MNWLSAVARPDTPAIVKAAPNISVQPPKRWSFDPDLAEWQFASDVPSETHPGTIGLSYSTLHSMSRIPVIGAVIQTRINQVAEFSRPQPNPYAVGYRIRHRDMHKELTKKDQAKIKEITEVITRAGGKYWYGGFEGFLRSVVRDSLTYDQANFEIIRERGGKPWGFVPVDPMTVRRARPSDDALREGKLDPDDIAFIQIMDNKVVNEFERGELAWCMRRPRSWVYSFGYGYPELEELIGTITNFLNAETFNAVNFTNGIHSRTILGLKSTMDQSMFKAFKREIVAMMSGVANARRVPIVQLDPEFKEELSAVPLDRSNREMEYREWLNFLLKVICGGFQMDPAEVNFVFGNEGQTSSLQSASVGDRVTMSREKGLRPLLRSVEYWLNEWVVQAIDEDYSIEFVGFEAETESQRIELDTKTVQHWMTVDEVRAQHDLEPLPDDQGKVVLNATWLQAKQAQDMADQGGEEEGGEFGDMMGGEEDLGGDEGGQDDEGDEGGQDDEGDEGDEGGEDLARSHAARQHGEVDGVDHLASRLKAIYDRRIRQMVKLMQKVDRGG
jgi:hypothetical protein